MRLAFLPLMASLMAAASGAQTIPGRDAQSSLTFDVVAIHPSPPDATGGGVKPLPNGSGYTTRNMTVKTLMAVMYRIPARQIEGGPGWFDTLRFDVEARADRGGYSMDELHAMFKNLLRERLGLTFHVTKREGPVYILMVDKGGMKMEDDGPAGGLNILITPVGPGQWEGKTVTMDYLCWFLSFAAPNDVRPVIDQTGLKDVYDFKLSFAPEPPVDGVPVASNLPVLRDALQEQLGLVLKPAKGLVDYYVIDHVSQPSAN